MLDLSLIAKGYRLRILDFLLLSAKENRNIYRLRTDTGDFVLKPVMYPPEEFAFIAEACAHWAKAGCRVAAVIPTADGTWTLEADGGRFFLMPYLPGKAVDFKQEAEVLQIAEPLAELHRRGEGFRCRCYPDRCKIGQFPTIVEQKAEDLRRWRRRLREQPRKQYFDFLYERQLGEALAAAEQVARRLRTYYDPLAAEYQKRGCLCHHDLANHNILLDRQAESPQTAVAFVDFDYCVSDLFVHDLASILLRLGKNNVYHASLALAFLRRYQKFLPLREGERRLLWDYLCFPQEIWQMGLAFYEEIPRLLTEKSRRSRCGRLDRRLTEYSDLVEPRRRFLACLKEEIQCGF